MAHSLKFADSVLYTVAWAGHTVYLKHMKFCHNPGSGAEGS